MKTTLATHLALWLSQAKHHKVLVIDMDTQNSISTFLAERPDTNHLGDMANLITQQSWDTLAGNHPDAPLHYLSGGTALSGLDSYDPMLVIDHMRILQSAHYDYVVIDTPPAVGNKLLSSIAVSNHVIVPCDFTKFALEGVNRIIRDINSCRHNDRIRSQTQLLCIVPTLITGNDADQIQRFITEAAKPTRAGYILNTPLRNRPVMRRTMNKSMVIWESKEGDPRDAIKEVRACMDSIYKLLTDQSDQTDQ